MEQREALWHGGGSPFAVGAKQFGMWLFVASDALTFATLLIVYTYSRLANSNWPAPFPLSPSILQASLMTLALLTSSLTMALAVQRMKAGDRSGTVRMIAATMALGVAFIAIHTAEWMHLIRVERVTLTSNPWNQPLFGATFFGLTGLHMAHVTGGILYLAVIAVGVGRDRFRAEDVETSGLYWHFVDLVWMFIFPMVYLMSVKL
ncbi:MAG TPA: cytochrome c oxidase subunit 3 [Bryobacteraceae bacterium]|nr:cytochrome c oxidase subunit 3 [Bryobacteraceae bacterium]